MSLIYITGPTASGKSTIRKKLSELGYKTYDADDEGMRVRKGDELVLERKKVEQIAAESKGKDVFLCGTVANDAELVDLFDNLFLLELDEDSQKVRIQTRTNSNYGKTAEQLATALRWRERQIDKYKELGATSIDATHPVSTIVELILGNLDIKE